MRENTRLSELEFETAVVSHLQDEHGLAVHVEGDALNRRRSGYAVLQFSYTYESGPKRRAKVRIAIAGASRYSHTFSLDLADPEAVADVSGLCEDLAPRIRQHLGQEEAQDARPATRQRRREED